MSNANLNRICNDENDLILRGLRTTQLEDFDPVHAFVWRDLEEIDMRSKSVIPRLANRIKELEEALQFYKSK
ncbi:hypothetical protein H5410_039671 [Solanum commersonii]|uniref:Uncharacterized protein n=1 Tax=Solanum commersonii TaxID=4109 RepID=A0A9J5XMS8_SOLCO|nr:hypothetical protein H5410_039671 [Solanum commersonii]